MPRRRSCFARNAPLLIAILLIAAYAMYVTQRRLAGADWLESRHAAKAPQFSRPQIRDQRPPVASEGPMESEMMPSASGREPDATDESQELVARVPHNGATSGACVNCCHDGNNFAPCLDVDACAAHGPASGKYAFVVSWVGKVKSRGKMTWLPWIGSMQQEAKSYNADIVLMMAKEDAVSLTPWHFDFMKEHHMRLVETNWSLPPNMRYISDKWMCPGKKPRTACPHDQWTGWCGPMDLVRLNAFALVEYDAVAYFDTDVEFQGSILPVFRCAASGYFLMAAGPMSPTNIGFFALRPSQEMMQAALIFAREADFNNVTGWAGAKFKPWNSKYVGAECGQGFLHTLFYKKTPLTESIWERAGLKGLEAPKAGMIDICIWNYQNHGHCPKTFDCTLVRAHHKPHPWKTQPGDCRKSTVEKLCRAKELPAAVCKGG